MGWGDEVLVSGEARRVHEATGKFVGVYDRKGRQRWCPLWENNPIILKPGDSGDHVRMINGSGLRFYVDYERMEREFKALFPSRPFTTKIQDSRLPYRFTDWKSARGELHFVKRQEPAYVVIEPCVKVKQPNRDWGWGRWQAVVDGLKDIRWVQINPPGFRRLEGVKHKPASSFISACHLLARAQFYVGPEGGLYHAAAAMGIPSVAIFGGYVSPANQGYPESINIYEPDGSPCGQRVPCSHCKAIFEQITPARVIEAIQTMRQRCS